MALTVEDGTGIASANSYITLANARAYAVDRGVALPADDAVLTALIIKAADYIESKQDRFVGTPVSPDQAMSWPRSNVLKTDGSAFPNDEIPVALKSAQCQCVIEEQSGIVLLPSKDNIYGQVVLEKVDVIETRYSPKDITSGLPSLPAVDALLKGLLHSVAALKVVRV